MDWSDLWLFGVGALAGWAFRPKAKQSNTQEKSFIIPSTSAHDRDTILRTYMLRVGRHVSNVPTGDIAGCSGIHGMRTHTVIIR